MRYARIRRTQTHRQGSEISVLWEHVARVFENRAAPAFAKLADSCEQPASGITDLDRYWLSVLFALQFVRVPDHLASIRAAGDRIAQRFATELASRGHPRDWMSDEMCRDAGINPADIEQFEWSPESFGPDGDFTAAIDQLSDIPSMLSPAFDDEVVASVFARSWMLVRFPQSGLTLPSQTGMHLRGNKAKGFYGAPGLATADQIWVPMSPDTLLVMHWKGHAYRAKDWTAETCVVHLGRNGSHQICHPDDAQHVMRVWQALRNSADELGTLIRDSTNTGETLAVL